MVSLRPRSASPPTEIEETSLSRSSSRAAPAEVSRRRGRRSSPKAERRRKSGTEPRRRRREDARANPSPPPLRRRVRRRSSPKAHRKSRHHEGKEKDRRKSEAAVPHQGRRRSPPNTQGRDVEMRKTNAEERSQQKAVERRAVEGGAAPKRASRKAEARSPSSEEIDGEPIAASGRPSADMKDDPLDIEESDLDGEPVVASQRPPADPSASDSEDASPDLDTRALSAKEPDRNKRALELEAKDAQARETFQERLRRKQMERSKAIEPQPVEITVAPDRSALQVAAMAIKAAAASGAAAAAAAAPLLDEAEIEILRPLTTAERTRKCAERAAALGLSCDFEKGRLLPPDRAAALISRGRRRRRGEELEDWELDVPPAPDEAPPPLPGAVPSPPVDPETIVRAAEAAQAAFNFEDFLKARSRAVQAPPKLAPVSEELKTTIAMAEVTRAKKLKRKKKGRDFDYDPYLDGESMSSSEEQRTLDELDGDSMDSSDEREGLACPTGVPIAGSIGANRLVGHIKEIFV